MTNETDAPAVDEVEGAPKPKAKPAAKAKPAPKVAASPASVWKSQTAFTEADVATIITNLGGDPETDKLTFTPEERDGVHGTTLKLEA